MAGGKARDDLGQILARRRYPLRLIAVWEGLVRFLDDGRIDIASNAVERAMRPIALGRKNLFARSDGGAEHWAAPASLIETCKRNDIDPQAYLADVLAKIVNRHTMSRIDGLLRYAYNKKKPEEAVA